MGNRGVAVGNALALSHPEHENKIPTSPNVREKWGNPEPLNIRLLLARPEPAEGARHQQGIDEAVDDFLQHEWRITLARTGHLPLLASVLLCLGRDRARFLLRGIARSEKLCLPWRMLPKRDPSPPLPKGCGVKVCAPASLRIRLGEISRLLTSGKPAAKASRRRVQGSTPAR